MVAEEYMSRARTAKANRLAAVVAPLGLSGDDIRVLVAAGAPVLVDVAGVAGVRIPSPRTWELVAVLLEERSRVGAALAGRVGYLPDPGDPFEGTS